ncbi:ABC transporter substrate-binding protein [Phycisphaera mikurensis]|uniref:Putative ABC transporter substrate binding protein n=1 Tax=Phycisphaera mikurensis (strain NBRC 102666 / KCTC 22515 / FYK2301M01) TaxID=1142394 RepID=I0IH51_PHYMF|nr:extracellular solute-binding protein [Phycisphaera mikurensis]MBB6440841.1 ABC-type Fe3+ transport system substrate-binding protein [Phycisphaera mikurensis]BAM04589.1 putative ABC transporter substrate binding protein [Phycisphaera mikurensis NBRC 102666]
MRDHLPKLLVVLALAGVIGLPYALRAFGLGAVAVREGPGGADARLVVYTPHNEQIREEFERAYAADRAARGLPAVGFDWRASGGTSDLRRGILDQFQALLGRGDDPEAALDRGIGADLLFGGGAYDHDKLIAGVEGPDGRQHPVSVAPDLPAGLLAEAFPSRDIGGEPLLGEDNRWTGTALSSFGIVYNRDLLTMLGLPEPRDWGDLAAPAYLGQVAMADPGHSSSVAATLETVLRRQGWTRGWRTLRRVFANSRYFAAASTKIPMDVARGDAAAGICIDFYGRFQAGFAAGEDGGFSAADVGYADPVLGGRSQTVASADPVTLLRGAPHRDDAEDFIAFVIRPAAQRLWQRRAGEPGGPARFELRRLPVLASLYTPEETATWTDGEARPFADASPVPDGVPGYFPVIAPVVHALAVDHHDLLVAAWEALLATPEGHPRRAEMLAAFDALPPALTLSWPDESLTEQRWWDAVADPSAPRHAEAAAAIDAFKLQLRGPGGDEGMKRQLAWSAFFEDRYEAVLALAAGTGG